MMRQHAVIHAIGVCMAVACLSGCTPLFATRLPAPQSMTNPGSVAVKADRKVCQDTPVLLTNLMRPPLARNYRLPNGKPCYLSED